MSSDNTLVISNNLCNLETNALCFDSLVGDWLNRAAIPGIQIATISNFNHVSVKSYGYKNFRTKSKINDSTVFRAASLSKPILGYLAALLVEEGLLDYDKPLYEYLPHPDLSRDPRSKLITAKMVLNHTSGMPNFRGYYGVYLLSQPGQMFNYSGEGYFYLQNVLEYITGTPFEQLAQEKIFIPLGMNNTSFEWQLSFNSNYAVPHDRFINPRPRNMQTYGCNAAASLITTADDYAKFILAVLQKEGLSDRTFSLMLDPSVKIFSYSNFLGKIFWSQGFSILDEGKNQMFFHWGDDYDYKCFMAFCPHTGNAVVFFTNSENGLNIKNKIVEHTLGRRAPHFHLLNHWQLD